MARTDNHTSRAPGKTTPGQIIAVSLWLGVGTGLCELGVLGFKKYALDQFILVSRQVVWMAPVGEALLFLLAGLALAVIAWRWPVLVTPSLVLVVLFSLAYLSLLLLVPGLSRWATLLLAAGLALQTSRLLAPRWQRFHRFVMRTVGPLIASLALIATVSLILL